MYLFLSHPWGPCCPAYAGGARVEINPVRCMDTGDSCNSIQFKASNHIGTHFDFPLHFDASGKHVLDYAPDFFIHEKTLLLSIELAKGALVTTAHVEHSLKFYEGSYDETLLLLRTGAESYRDSEDFWKNGTGLDIGLASYLRSKFPRLTTVGMDSISLSSFPHRDLGRKAHAEFLKDSRPLLLIEDMHLASLKQSPKKVMALPLRIEKGDGAPCTVLAEL